MGTIKEKLKERFVERLNGDCIAGFITKQDMMKHLEDFDKWLGTAVNGDLYYYEDEVFLFKIEYGVRVWSKEQRELGEPMTLTPASCVYDLEAVKKEVESYDIKKGGCAEIFIVGEDESFLHYENGEWEYL